MRDKIKKSINGDIIRCNQPEVNETELLDRIIIECDTSTKELIYLNKSGIRHGKNIPEPEEEIIKDSDIKKNRDDSGLITLGQDNVKDTSVREYQDNETGFWYQCWDSVIRWYNGKQFQLEIIMDITGKKKTESHIKELGCLRDRLVTTQVLEIL